MFRNDRIEHVQIASSIQTVSISTIKYITWSCWFWRAWLERELRLTSSAHEIHTNQPCFLLGNLCKKFICISLKLTNKEKSSSKLLVKKLNWIWFFFGNSCSCSAWPPLQLAAPLPVRATVQNKADVSENFFSKFDNYYLCRTKLYSYTH